MPHGPAASSTASRGTVVLARRRLLQGAAVLPVLTGCDWWFGSGDADGGGSTYQTTIAEGRRLIDEAMRLTDTPSISIALLDDQDVVWSEAFGKIRSDQDAAATEHTLYNIGSVSKVLTAVAVMQLVDRGQVELDAPVTRYLPTFRMLSPDYTTMTVRMLLNHSSGLPGTFDRNIFTFQPSNGYAKETQEVMADLHLKAPPGEFSVYCNDGFTLAGQLVAEVSGLAYPDYVRRHIFQPLGMNNSEFCDVALPEGRYAHSRVNGQVMGQEFVRAYATGGAISTPDDMLKLASMFLNEGLWRGTRILSAAAVREMAQSQVRQQAMYVYPDLPFGLGWDAVAQAGLAHVGVRCWQKNGGTALYSSDFYVLPNERLALMICGASAAYGAGTLAEKILLQALVERGSLQALPGQVAPYSAPETPPPGELDSMVGCYDGYNCLYRLERESQGNGLALWYWLDNKWELLQAGLRRRANGDYAVDESAVQAYRVATVQGISYLQQRIKVGQGHYRVLFPIGQRLEPGSTLSATWRNRLNQEYALVNEDYSSVIFEFEPPLLVLQAAPELSGYVLLNGQQAMLPVDGDRTGMVLKIPVNSGRDLREVVAEARGTEEWLWVNGQRYRPTSGIPRVGMGRHQLEVEPEGYTLWLQVEQGSRLEVQGDPIGWRYYDAQWQQQLAHEGNGAATISSAPGWLGLFGKAGQRLSVLIS